MGNCYFDALDFSSYADDELTCFIYSSTEEPEPKLTLFERVVFFILRKFR